MRIRSDQELFDKIDEELVWRRADISRLRKLILDNRGPNELIYKTLLRSSIPLIYAHWEGFIKEASLAYFNFIALRKFKFNELTQGFLSLYIQNEFINGNTLSDFEKAISINNFFTTELDNRSDIKKVPEPIKTRSNLNSTILKEIILILELDYEKFRGFENFLDSKLLNLRNKIAHGEYKDVSWADYDEVHKVVAQLMVEYKDQVQNNVVLKKYFKQAVYH